MREAAVADAGQLLIRLFAAGLEAAHGARLVRRALGDEPVPGPVGVVAVGKAAGAMYQGAESVLGPRLVDGLVIVPAGGPLREEPRARVVAGAHPVPDERSLRAGRSVLDYLATAPGTVLFLISGGASSLMEVPRPGVSARTLAQVNEWLLGAGLPIHAMNAVRARLSAIKHGGLLGFVGDRRIRALILSDVPGDDPAVVGSGPLSAGRRPDLPEPLPDWLVKLLPEEPPAPEPVPPVHVSVIGGIRQALDGVLAAARDAGLAAHVHEPLEGDAMRRGRELAAYLETAPAGVHVWGGETTVTLPERPGYGGRNQALALAAARVLSGREDVSLLAAGTDGRDGVTSHAGAVVDGTTVARAAGKGLDVERSLEEADAGTLFERTGDALVTGPTGTNVMDLVIAWRS